jgi:hypothetical protein
MDAAQLASALEAWDSAAHIYERLMELMPALRPALVKPLSIALEKARAVQARN